MHSRREFLKKVMVALTAASGAVVALSVPQVYAALQEWYVWYRKGEGRWHGVGPYKTYKDAENVESDYIKQGYTTYIGGKNG